MISFFCFDFFFKKKHSLRNSRKAQAVSVDDIELAIKKLEVLGGGIRTIKIGKRKMVQFVPIELDNDHAAVLGVAQKAGWVTRSSLATELSWTSLRIDKVLQPFLREGIAWVDSQAEGEDQYWFPSLLSIW